jgi:RNA polymerase primary sigma factor
VRQVELKTKNFLERYLAAFNQDEELDASSSADAA